MMKLAMSVSPYPTFPRLRWKGQTNRCASFTLMLALLGAFATVDAMGAELSALQTAMHIAQDEMESAMKERDADARRVSAGEKELERLKSQLEADRKKASKSAGRYLESKKKYDQAQSALDKAWKK